MKPAVLTGVHFINGDVACAEGAIAAGCLFFGGYPITPATEVAEHISLRLPDVGGTFIQMEDEIAAMTSILGSAWTGVKSMTATSGPGFSLMMETIGLAVVTETPCVVVNVQRGGPSTGLPTQGAQSDMMQAKWGSHGDYEIIAIAPSSPQEMFDFTITAFNLSEKYRVPVFIMSDEIVGHMSEKVIIPDAKKIKTVSRPKPKGRQKKGFKPFKPGPNGVAPMPSIGEGYNVHVTGLTHDEKGYPVMSVDTQSEMMDRLLSKIRNNLDDIIKTESYLLDDAEIVIVSYGVATRTSYTAVDEARKMGFKAGLLRLITVWPFPDALIQELAKSVKGFVTVEINMGQISREVQRCVGDKAPSYHVGHPGGAIIPPEDVLNLLKEVF
ncbi:MAG: 2-oxoacid:acceptor oxidoreductase subunit alpha [Deltaproteobacteria bacterium]|nr:2-oxoacid:acceptor oxidoreductase subunit alpha [Deltaproteobacteria bacterium]